MTLSRLDVACWDTGGSGQAVILMHAASGSGEHWSPQLHTFHAAGYRAIAWSRRGHQGSERGPSDPGEVVTDLDHLADALGIAAFHLVGTAFGAFGALDYALARPYRLMTVTLAASLCGVTDPGFVEETRQLIPRAWERLPAAVRELSPAYRYRDPDGTAAWAALTRRAVHHRVHQRPTSVLTRASLAGHATPTLFLTGDADPYMPPERLRRLAACVPGASHAVVDEAGHSPSWENPTQFDALVLDFLASPGRRATRNSVRTNETTDETRRTSNG